MKDQKILIVGAGPTGLMMACQLAMRGIPFHIIDKTDDHTIQSRAIVIQARSMEIFDQMGIAEKFGSAGHIGRLFGLIFNGRKTVTITVKGGNFTKFPYMLMLAQSETEKILLEFLRELGHQVERRTELVHYVETTDGVNANVKRQDGSEETIRATYLIGCDGAHSVVREQHQTILGGETYPLRMYVIDCRADVHIAHDELYMALSSKGTVGFFPMPTGRFRVIGVVPKDLEEKETITFEDIQARVASEAAMDVQIFDPSWMSVYRTHHRYAPSFRFGNCFILGDAAHIHSPLGGQGMNTGLQDAYNLAWKLAMIIQGVAKPKLLDTYDMERIGIAKRLVRTTDTGFGFMTSNKPLIKTIRSLLLPVFLQIAMRIVNVSTMIREKVFRIISEIGINYRESLLSQDASMGAFSRHAPCPGDRVPYIQFRESGEQTDTLQKLRVKNFRVFAFPGKNLRAIAPIIEELRRHQKLYSIMSIERTSETENVYAAFGIVEAGCYIIRPDMYVAYRTSEPDTEHLKKYMERVGLVG
jgi:2-polyprenyl-6-methoxyphenol hydroxylase-like FAD-dependent oxidoreductase